MLNLTGACRGVQAGRISLLLMLSLLAGVTQAEQDHHDDRRVLAAVGHSDYPVRQAMTDRLLQDDELAVDQIVQWYQQAESLEQQQRLRTVAYHHLLRQIRLELFPDGHRGSLGLRLEGAIADQTPQLGQAAARVVQTYPGFPAFAYLREGDLVVGVMGEPLPDTGHSIDVRDHFIRKVASHGPGQPVRLRLWRDGEFHDVQFNLANYDALENMYDIHTSRLHPPYQQRWEALLARLQQNQPPQSSLTVDWPER